MRKIDKNLQLALAFKDWLTTLGDSNHPQYTSQNEYYKDIVANLLWVQDGLCAYTEKFLINSQRVSPDKWVDGKFDKIEIDGDLDHYNPKLKTDFGWDWSNFFLIDKNTNSSRVKGVKVPNSILKPDNESYDPFHFLEYDYEKHIFCANSILDFEQQVRVKEDIDILGLNYQPIIDFREKYLNPIILDVQNKQKTLELARKDLIQFKTAFEMSLQNLNLEVI